MGDAGELDRYVVARLDHLARPQHVRDLGSPPAADERRQARELAPHLDHGLVDVGGELVLGHARPQRRPGGPQSRLGHAARLADVAELCLRLDAAVSLDDAVAVDDVRIGERRHQRLVVLHGEKRVARLVDADPPLGDAEIADDADGDVDRALGIPIGKTQVLVQPRERVGVTLLEQAHDQGRIPVPGHDQHLVVVVADRAVSGEVTDILRGRHQKRIEALFGHGRPNPRQSVQVFSPGEREFPLQLHRAIPCRPFASSYGPTTPARQNRRPTCSISRQTRRPTEVIRPCGRRSDRNPKTLTVCRETCPPAAGWASVTVLYQT